MRRKHPLLLAAAALAAASPVIAGITDSSRSALAQSLSGARRASAVYVVGGDGNGFGAASGVADLDAGRRLTVDTPLRMASNTKTFTAATVLRLWEEGRIDLDAPIAPLLTPAIDALLRADGYATDRITVRQLLSHSAGLYDHGGDKRFTEAIFSEPGRRWTREELVRLSMRYADPQSEPGTEFRYSDTGYVLLGDIIERETGVSLAAAVRHQLGLDRLGLRVTWWEIMESPPGGAEPRARQWLGEREATHIDASMDLYGGGGLVMSARDLATFMAALFGGRVFRRPETLREMVRQGDHKGADQYRLGIFVKRVGERDYYWHSGFWGSVAYYDPEARVAAAGVTVNQDGFPELVRLVERTIGAGPPARPQ